MFYLPGVMINPRQMFFNLKINCRHSNAYAIFKKIK